MPQFTIRVPGSRKICVADKVKTALMRPKFMTSHNACHGA